MKKTFQRLGGFFNKKFGSRWMADEETFWKEVTSGEYVPGLVILRG